MRYDNWDVILFPGDSHVPIQEFKTSCHIVQDDCGRQLPTLNCFIASRPPTTPFRISVHSWTRPKPTLLIDSQGSANQRVVYTLRVIIDGTRVFQNYYEPSAQWPQEIEHEKRWVDFPNQPLSQRKFRLQFPSFRQYVLTQSCWDARENNGRIKIFLSEQLLHKSAGVGKWDLGTFNDLVCFSFQHAPREILEQANICWPIRNPLYLPMPTNSEALLRSRTPVLTKHHNTQQQCQSFSPPTNAPGLPFTQPGDPEPFAKPKGDIPLGFASFPRSINERTRARLDTSNEAFGYTYADPFEDVNMDNSWSTRPVSSNSNADTSMVDLCQDSLESFRSKENRAFFGDTVGFSSRRGRNESRKGAEQTQVVMTFRDDQFGKLIEAFSPSKHITQQPPSIDHHSVSQDESASTQAASSNVPIMTRPSAAAIARMASYPDLRQRSRISSSRTLPSQQSQTIKSQGIQKWTAFHHPKSDSDKENRIPTPHPNFRILSPARLVSWESDVSMKEASSMNSNQCCVHKEEDPAGISADCQTSSIQTSNIPTNEREGIMAPTSTLLLAQVQPKSSNVADNTTHKTIEAQARSTKQEHTQSPLPSHRGSTSSLGKIEEALLSALGSFEANPSTNEDSSDTKPAQVGSSPTITILSPIPKRKREGTISETRGKISKLYDSKDTTLLDGVDDENRNL